MTTGLAGWRDGWNVTAAGTIELSVDDAEGTKGVTVTVAIGEQRASSWLPPAVASGVAKCLEKRCGVTLTPSIHHDEDGVSKDVEFRFDGCCILMVEIDGMVAESMCDWDTQEFARALGECANFAVRVNEEEDAYVKDRYGGEE